MIKSVYTGTRTMSMLSFVPKGLHYKPTVSVTIAEGGSMKIKQPEKLPVTHPDTIIRRGTSSVKNNHTESKGS